MHKLNSGLSSDLSSPRSARSTLNPRFFLGPETHAAAHCLRVRGVDGGLEMFCSIDDSGSIDYQQRAIWRGQEEPRSEWDRAGHDRYVKL
jgi:hypothetical protein